MKELMKCCLPPLIAFACILVPLAIFTAGIYVGEEAMERIAVAHGKAEYLTAENGKQIWRWKP